MHVFAVTVPVLTREFEESQGVNCDCRVPTRRNKWVDHLFVHWTCDASGQSQVVSFHKT